MSVQVKVTVICHIDDRILIRLCFVVDHQSILFIQRIGHFHNKCSRISLIPIRAVHLKCYMSIICIRNLPHSSVIEIKSAVQVVLSVILCQVIFCSIDLDHCPTDTVCVTSDRCSECISKSGFISGCIIISKCHFYRIVIFIRNKYACQCCSEVRYADLHSCFIFQCIYGSQFPFRCLSKVFFL